MGGGRDYYLADFDKFAASNAVSAENELEKSRGVCYCKIRAEIFFPRIKLPSSRHLHWTKKVLLVTFENVFTDSNELRHEIQIENPTNDRDHTITALTNSQSIVIVIIINGPTFNF